MSLQTKFAILLAVLGTAVVVAFSAAWWSLEVSYREVRGPVKSSSQVLDQLIMIEKLVDELRALADPGNAFGASPEPAHSSTSTAASLGAGEFRERISAINSLLDNIRTDDVWTGFAGKSATTNLTQKLADLNRMGISRFGADARDPDRDFAPLEGDVSPPQFSAHLFQIHELLKRMEKRVVDDIRNVAKSAADLRTRLFFVLGLALTLVALNAALALLLVRRWILRPISELRTAAARIAAGDFEHRIPVPSTALGDEITSLSTEVNHMAGMVKQLQSERIEQERLAAIGEMVRRLAHNLRNPLAGIRGLAELTRVELSDLGLAAEAVGEMQGRIISSVDRFEGWLSDLLNVTKPANIHVEPTDAARWLAGLVEAHSPLAQTRKVVLSVDQQHGPGKVAFDPRHLEHAVSAILSNAIEATASHSNRAGPARVRIVSQVVEIGQPGRIWELCIEDSGPGVPPDLREKIFKPYFTTKRDGNGIGLAVAMQVVRAHRGELTVEDAESGPEGREDGSRPTGARFRIRLPLDRRPTEDTQVASIGH